MSNVVLERIHQVLGDLVQNFKISQTYVDKNYPWIGILSETVFENFSTTNRQKGYSLGKLLFFHDMILPIKHKVDWSLIRQRKQAKTNKDNIRKNRHRVDHDYKIGDNFMIK